MKKLPVSIFLLTMFSSGALFAQNHTVSLGYAQGRVGDNIIDTLRGINLQYRYEFDYNLSIVGSLSYLTHDYNESVIDDYHKVRGSADTKYYSFLVGPGYRINNYFSLYALAGFAHTKADVKVKGHYTYSGKLVSRHYDSNSTNPAWGAGVLINPTNELSIYVGYEGSIVKIGDNKFNFNGHNKFTYNGFNIGAGYRF